MLCAGTRVEQASTRHLSPTPLGVWPAGVRSTYAQCRGNTGTQLLENWPDGNIGQGPGSHPPRLNLVVDRPPWMLEERLSRQPPPGTRPCVPVPTKSPGPLRRRRDPTLRNIVCVVRMRACTSSVAMLTSGLLRDCGSGAFSKLTERTLTVPLRLLWYRSPAQRCTSRLCPTRRVPTSAACLMGCGQRSLTARVQCPHGTTTTYGSP